LEMKRQEKGPLLYLKSEVARRGPTLFLYRLPGP